MAARIPLPAGLGASFAVREARAAGVSEGRLRGSDLRRPFHGARTTTAFDSAGGDRWAERRDEILWLASAYAPRLRDDQFFSHETALAIFGAPLFGRGDVTLHVSVLGQGSFPRARGVQGHRAQPAATSLRSMNGWTVSSYATTWAMLGAELSRDPLVAVGDFGCRMWRAGWNRPHPGRPALTTTAQLEAAMHAGRHQGIARLRRAHPLIRCDSWSPRETATRLALIDAGLPEPQLNQDVYDAFDGPIACVDLSYPDYKVAIEYQGQAHGEKYARDVERIERLRAEGWIVIQVTSETLRYPTVVTRRVREALVSRGWSPRPRLR